MNGLPRFWRRLRRWLAGTLASVLILAAVAMALGQLLLPFVLKHPERIAAVLAERLGQPVRFDHLRGEWQASGPLFVVDGLHVGAGEAALTLPTAALKLDFGAWLSPTRRWLVLRLSDVALKLRRDNDARWHVAGLGSMPTTGPAFDGRLPVDLEFTDLALAVDDALSGRHWQFHAARLRVIGRSGQLRIGGLLDGAGAAPLRVVADIDPRDGDATFYAAGQQLDLPAWAEALGIEDWHLSSGRADLRTWANWQGGALQSASVNLRLGALALDHGARHLDLPSWNGLLQLRRAEPGWQVDYRDTTRAEVAASAWFARDDTHGLRLQLDADTLDLATLLPWLQVLPELSNHAADWLRGAAPRGQLHDLHLAWAGVDAYRLRASLDRVGFAPAARVPGLSQLSGTLVGDAQALSLELPAQALTVTVPGVFRQPFHLRRIGGSLSLWRADSGWRLGSDGLQFDGEDYAGSLRGRCTFPATGAPVLDVAAVVDHAEVPAAKRFWPVNVMPASAVEWLDRALVSGQVTGRAVFRGPLDDFPFSDGNGRFEAIADFNHTLLDFHPDWPKAEGLRGRASFVGNGMEVSVQEGSSLGVPADAGSGRIADFHHAVLELAVNGHGDAGRLLAYLRKTPVGKDFGPALAQLRAKGPAKARFTLTLPLHGEAGQQAVLDGHADLAGVDFAVPDWNLALGKLKGALAFDSRSLDASGIAASYGGRPVTLGIRIGSAVRDPAQQLEADLQGQLDAATLTAAYPDLAWLKELVLGDAAFTVELGIGAEDGAAAGRKTLTIGSDLRGITLALPAPLAKPASAVLPLTLSMQLPFAGRRMDVRLGKVANAVLALPGPQSPLGMDVGLGASAAVAPQPGHLRIHGDSDQLDVSNWLARVFGGMGGDAMQLDGLDIAARHALLDQRDLGALHVIVAPGRDSTRLSLDGAAVKGAVELPRVDLALRGITARLDKLHWPAGGDDDKPVSQTLSPAALPPLHLWVRDLRLGEARLGEVHFESVPIDGGMQIEQFDAQSNEVQISARGRWSGSATANASHLTINFSSGDLGRMLDAFGYKGLVAGGTTLAHIDGSWPGPPSAFSLAAMDGSMKVHVSDGRILDVDPGVGRLFGLFSIRELPRRLSLDFGDIFQSGFAFNTIDGHFAFADGNARTDDLLIRGPAAEIKVSGRTGLKAKDYEQTIMVTPHVGVALPVVGALAAGPVGAAAGLAVQTLIGKGLNRAAAAHYRITGSWDKPEIQLLSRDRPKAPPSPSLRAVPAASAVAPATARSAPDNSKKSFRNKIIPAPSATSSRPL